MTRITQRAQQARRHVDPTTGDLDLGDALVIVHPLLSPALEQNLAALVAPALWRAVTRSSLYATSRLRLGHLAGEGWQQLLHETERDERPLQQMFSARSGPALYFGVAPVPVTLELGRRLGPTHRVLAYYDGPRAPGASDGL